MGKKEALSFLKKNNTSIIQAWQNYKIQIGRSNNSKLDEVFEQMFKAWLLSNKKAITLLEKTPKRPTKVKETPFKKKNSKTPRK